MQNALSDCIHARETSLAERSGLRKEAQKNWELSIPQKRKEKKPHNTKPLKMRRTCEA